MVPRAMVGKVGKPSIDLVGNKIHKREIPQSSQQFKIVPSVFQEVSIDSDGIVVLFDMITVSTG